jgi:Cu-Zn family superoxide dismutase
MLTPARARTFTAAAALVPVVASAALISACSAPQYPATSPGTQPPIWTGSPAPSSAKPTGSQGGTDSLTTQLNDANGTKVATAKFEFNQGYVTITIETTGTGQLSPGFHGVHIHSVGKCEAHSVAPTGGEPGDFLSAGGHFMPHGQHGAGDLTSLQVRKDGGALLETTTDGFTKADLLGGAGTSIVIHAGADNFGNIPADRYSQVNGAPGADQTTKSTGDAGKRVACGVIGTG